jgi:uncharacterized repeat protein (TIGR03803 family)
MRQLAVRKLLPVLFLLTFGVVAMPVVAQTFSVLHTFTGGADGGLPMGGMILDQAGNLYGTAMGGGTGPCSNLGTGGCGTIFQLKKHNSSWIFNPLYSFQGGTDGAFPVQALTRGPNGTYYGTTGAGGGGSCNVEGAPGCGTVFNVGPNPTPPRTAFLKFRESVLCRFTGDFDGTNPYSTVIFDQAGNIYGTTAYAGANGAGTVFELSPTGGGNYTQTVLHSFAGGSDGANPYDGVVFDTAGNLYGTAASGGTYGQGVVFELSPTGGGNYTETVIHSFSGSDGTNPYAGVAIDSTGNLYGNTSQHGPGGGGTVYELARSGNNWNFNLLYSVPGQGYALDRVTLDASGNLYETLSFGGAFGMGQVLELARSGSNWTFVGLHDFTNGSDGARPIGGVVLDSNGNLYGTTQVGVGTGCGGDGCGVVWEITQ